MQIAIFATGRNGSTLLMRLLDGSPDLWVHPIEVNYLSVFSDLYQFGRIKPLTSFNATTNKPLMIHGKLHVELLTQVFSRHIDEMNRIVNENLGDHIEVKVNPLQKLFQKDQYSSNEFLLDFIECIRSVYDDRSSCGPKYTVFKSIETPYIEEYSETFPEIRFIHIIRHPFTNYSSLKRTNMLTKRWPFWHHGGDELRMFLEKRWIPHLKFIVNASLPGSDKHYLVRYEDLCDRPEETIKGICQWLQIKMPVDPALQTALGGKLMMKLPLSSSKKGVRSPGRVVNNMAKMYGYEDVLTTREKGFILSRTYDLAHEVGYFTENEKDNLPSRRKLARKWLLPDKWELMGAGSKLRFVRALLERRFYIYSKLLFPSK